MEMPAGRRACERADSVSEDMETFFSGIVNVIIIQEIVHGRTGS